MSISILLISFLVKCADSLPLETETSRSSTFHTTADHALLGHVIGTWQTRDFISCAHTCLKHLGCASVNYESIENGACEVNTRGLENVANILSRRAGYVFGELVDFNAPFMNEERELQSPLRFDFTTLGAAGRTGPQNTSGYLGSQLEGKVQLDGGIQIWTVPANGTYVIEAWGASGANGTCQTGLPQCTATWRLGGLGARVRGTFYLSAGTKLKILVGQEGQRCADFGQRPGGGGGGSFVTLANNIPLVVAGGGGGGGLPNQGSGDGDPGQVSKNGSRCGGSDGQGGKHCNANTGTAIQLAAGGGAGLSGDGSGLRSFTGGFSFINGGEGGMGTSSHGGFGGGGFGMTQAGGGGGFSGGGIIGVGNQGCAGGGGSYNTGIMQDNKAGVNKGDGRVTIAMIS